MKTAVEVERFDTYPNMSHNQLQATGTLDTKCRGLWLAPLAGLQMVFATVGQASRRRLEASASCVGAGLSTFVTLLRAREQRGYASTPGKKPRTRVQHSRHLSRSTFLDCETELQV
jgi:hypothetical protein